MLVQGQTEALQRLFIKSSRYTILLAVPVLATFTTFAHPLMHHWMGRALGPEDTAAAAYILAGWATIEFAVTLEGSSTAIMFGMKKLRFVVWANLIATILGIVGSIWLISSTDLGLRALVVVPACIELVVRPTYIWYTSKQIGLPFLPTLRQIMGRPMAVLAGLFVLNVGLYYLLPTFELWGMMIALVIDGIAFIGLAWAFGITEDERQMVMRKVKSRKHGG